MAKKRPRTRSVSYAESNCSSSSYNSQEGVYLGKIGTLIADRYEIFNELGTGTFGRVLACIDKQ